MGARHWGVAIAAAALLSIPLAASAKDPQRVPKRLSSVGDSISEAINAEEFNPLVIVTPNPWASWVNGYSGFWEWLFGRTNVNSHNQRITSKYGSMRIAFTFWSFIMLINSNVCEGEGGTPGFGST